MRSKKHFQGFSLVEVVVALGVFAFAIVAIVGLLSVTTKSVADSSEEQVAQRLASNVQIELQRLSFNTVVTLLPNAASRLYLVADPTGERVLPTGENPVALWTQLENGIYVATSGGDTVAAPMAAENSLSAGTPLGIAYRDRFYLIEISTSTNPPVVAGSGYLPLSIKIVWPYRLPNGQNNAVAASTYNTHADLPWQLVAPAQHSSLQFNTALTP